MTTSTLSTRESTRIQEELPTALDELLASGTIGIAHLELEGIPDWWNNGPQREDSDWIRYDLLEAAEFLGARQIKVTPDGNDNPWDRGRWAERFAELATQAVSAQAYNSMWQFRLDSWSRLEEASARLAAAAARGASTAPMIEVARELFNAHGPIERFWAYPGAEAYARTQSLFESGDFDGFARLVGRINRGLVTESYRAGTVWPMADGAHAIAEDENPTAEPSSQERPYFEVLVVETLTPSQEHALREEIRSWRRPSDEFIYELVIVGSGEEAILAARLNANLQACVIRRRFTHAAAHDLSSLAHFLDPNIAYDLAGRLSHHFRRVFHAREGALEVHLSILAGIAARYRTPFFEALREHSRRPTGVFHALPISQGKSIVNSHWIKDMVDFYGLDIFLAETSSTGGGLDSLLDPTGPLRDAQRLAADTFGSRQTYFVTNGTSTANKIIAQALVAPGDIVLVDRNCHQSHHYGLMLSGAQVCYLEAYPLNEYSMYGGVPIREIKSKLLVMRAAGKLDRVKMLLLTNCTFDGVVYDVERVMEECLAIKPDLVFLWDEAWFAFARFHPVYRPRTAMRAARTIADRLRQPEYRARYQEQAPLPDDDASLLARRLSPDPARARVRVYSTRSTADCEFQLGDEIEARLEAGEQIVSSTFVTPYPPGFPVLVPGQLFSREIRSFMRSLDIPAIHGYRPDAGYAVFTEKAIEREFHEHM